MMEQQLKQRLIGAVVLVSLAVIFIPVILEGPEDKWAPRTHEIPASPELDYRASMNLPLPDTAPQDGAPTPESPPRESGTKAVVPESAAAPPVVAANRSVSEHPAAAAAATEAPVPSAPAATTGSSAPPTTSPPPSRPVPPPTPAPVTGPPPGWYAQLGSFGQQSNAASLRDTLTRAGFTVRIQKVVTGRGTSYRVLAGPEPDRSRAESLLLKVGKQMKTTGIVIEIGPGG